MFVIPGPYFMTGEVHERKVPCPSLDCECPLVPVRTVSRVGCSLCPRSVGPPVQEETL